MASEKPAARIVDRASAESFVAGLFGTMRDLQALLDRESEGVRAGRLRDALADTEAKSALSGAYMTGLETAKANAVALKRFAPHGVEALKIEHQRFAAAVESNQIVLATARTVSEGLIRTLADEIGKSRAPTVYGHPASQPSPYGRGAARGGPLVFSKSL